MRPLREVLARCPVSERSALPFAAIPTPRGLPLIGTALDVIRNGGATRLHEYCVRRHAELGPLYRENLGAVEAVFVGCPRLFENIYRKDGMYPEHLVPGAWEIYNKKRRNARGLFFMNGQQWQTRRRMLNKIFLRSSTEHDQVFKEVVEDVMHRWRGFSSTGTGVLPGLERELYNWSVESLGMLIFGRRLGCVRGATMNEFVQCVQRIFVESSKMTIIPPKMAYTLGLPVWFRFMNAADRALELAKEYVVENLRSRSGILAEMMQEKDISEEEIVRIVVDLFLAAADTTSHSTQWSLYLLSKNPECQERLYQEIKSLGGVDLDQMSYVKAVVKEALRLYPVAPFLTRFTTTDMELAGYHIPKGKLFLMSLFATSRDPRYFQDPLAFRPERWLGNLQAPVSCPYASIPFGAGPRGCIGRRVAEKQMHLLLSKVVEEFRLEPEDSAEVDISMRLITTPREPIRLRLCPR